MPHDTLILYAQILAASRHTYTTDVCKACVLGISYGWMFKHAVKNRTSCEDAFAQSPLNDKWDEVKKLLKGDAILSTCNNDGSDDEAKPTAMEAAASQEAKDLHDSTVQAVEGDPNLKKAFVY